MFMFMVSSSFLQDPPRSSFANMLLHFCSVFTSLQIHVVSTFTNFYTGYILPFILFATPKPSFVQIYLYISLTDHWGTVYSYSVSGDSPHPISSPALPVLLFIASHVSSSQDLCCCTGSAFLCTTSSAGVVHLNQCTLTVCYSDCVTQSKRHQPQTSEQRSCSLNQVSQSWRDVSESSGKASLSSVLRAFRLVSELMVSY